LAANRFFFPEWINQARPLAGVFLTGTPVYLLFLLYFGGSPRTTDVGYSPQQPVPYSHQVHVGQMGLDCRYCHTTVGTAAFAAVPPTSVCMNCHMAITPESEKLQPVRESMQSGNPVRWIHVHDLPDFVYFDHHAHVSQGVSCLSCHGRIDRMEQVHQVETLSMDWCLACHRNPAPNLRPREYVTDLNWTPEENPQQLGERLMREYNISPSTNCSTCHR
jgi:hypothetical protein